MKSLFIRFVNTFVLIISISYVSNGIAWDGDIGEGWYVYEPTATTEWDSGYTKNLSDWEPVKCWKRREEMLLWATL